MFSAASIESVCLNWMLSLALFVFILAFYLWFMPCKINITEKDVRMACEYITIDIRVHTTNGRATHKWYPYDKGVTYS